MAEIIFERFATALEATKGTAVTPPTVVWPAGGTLIPRQDTVRAPVASGLLAANGKSRVVRSYGEFSTGTMPLDFYNLPVALSQAVGTGVIATPVGGTLSRTHTYDPSLTTDYLRAATYYFGDSATQIWRGAYGMISDMTITSDVGAGELSTLEFSGFTQFPTEVAAPTWPAATTLETSVPADLQLWIDTSSAIGTTAITGRVISASHTLGNNLSRKHFATGPGGSRNFARHGRGPRALQTVIVFELADVVQYDLWAAQSFLKVRVRHNGELIEGSLYNYLEVDTYGTFSAMDWGTYESTNRTIQLTIDSAYDDAAITAGWDWKMVVQNERTAIS